MSKTTTKKTRIIGTQTYLNTTTGETEDFNVIEESDADYNFQKIWLGHILASLDLVGNKKIKVVNYFLAKKDSQNRVIATQRQIAKELEISLPVVSETIKMLQSTNLLKQVQQGVYMLNPDSMFKGGYNNRMNVVIKYREIGDQIDFIEEANNKGAK